MIFIKVWFLLGSLTNIFYHYKNRERYKQALISGEVSLSNFILGGFLTLFLWPVAIYNNEKR